VTADNIYAPTFALPTINRRPPPRFGKHTTSVAQQAIPNIIESLRFEQQRRAAETSLYEFVKQSWHIIEPGVEFSEGWHIHTICDHLEAVTDRRIKNLIINIPPRHSKSTIVTVIWPVWSWLKNPSEKFLTASYSGTLSVRDSVKSRRLLESHWFKARWPNISLNRDQNTKQRYENQYTGYRIATSVGSTTTGEGGSGLICLRGDTLIETSDGQIAIKKIVENQLQTTVTGYNHVTGKVQQDRIIRYDKNPPKQMLSIKTKSGREIVLTDDHPVFVIGRGYIPSSEVKSGDRLLCRVQQRVGSETESDKKGENAGVRERLSSRVDTEPSGGDTMCDMRQGGSAHTCSSGEKRDGYLLLKGLFRKVTKRFKQ